MLGVARYGLSSIFFLAPACAGGQAACGPPVESAAPGANEIVLDAQDEDPLPEDPASRPCMKDDPNGCGTPDEPAIDETEGVVEGKHYAVEVLPSDPSTGPSNAPVTLVVFSDFECPFCGRLEPTLDELRQRYPNALRIVWKDHPLGMHVWARPASLLGREAFSKGGNALFWRVHDQIFENQNALSEVSLESVARQHGLPWPPREQVNAEVDMSLEQARRLGIRSTPTSFVNGRAVVGSQPIDAFTQLIDDELRTRGATPHRAASSGFR